MKKNEIISLVKRIEVNSLLDIITYRNLSNQCRINSDDPIILTEFLANLLNEDIYKAWSQYENTTLLEQSDSNLKMYQPLVRNSAFRIYHSYAELMSRYQQFRHLNIEKSYLLSALVGQDHYLQVKQDLITFAQQIIAREFVGNWQIKAITTDNEPFKLINIFITNTSLPQLVYLTSDLILLFKRINEHVSYDHSDMDNTVNTWLANNKKMQTYLYCPVSLVEAFAAQLHYLTPINKEKLNDFLNKQLEQAIKHDLDSHHLNEGLPKNDSNAIRPFTLDKLYKQYCKQQAAAKMDLELNPKNVAQNPELQTLANSLLDILANN